MKKCVFRADLNVVSVATFLMYDGSEFQTEELTYLNILQLH